MATSWKSQQGEGKYALQFETDSKEKYKLVEKAAQMAVDGKTIDDVVEVRHGKWLNAPTDDYYTGEKPSVVGMVDGEPYASCYCSECLEWLVASDEYLVKGYYCPNCGAKMDGKENDYGNE